MCCDCIVIKRFIKRQVLTFFSISSVIMTGFGSAILLHANCLTFCSLGPKRGGQSVGLTVALVFVLAFFTGRTSVYRRGTFAYYALIISHPLVVATNLLAMWYLPVRCVACFVLATASAAALVCLWVLVRFGLLPVGVKFCGLKSCFWMVAAFVAFQLVFWLVIVMQG